MNILVKGSDFSEVSIGNAGIMTASAVLTNVFIQANGWAYAYALKTLCLDVTGCKYLQITGYNSQYSGTTDFARFYSVDAITQDQSYDQSGVDELNTYLGTIVGSVESPTPSSGVKTVTVEVPEGAKTLLVYSASDVSNVNVIDLGQ